MQVAPCHLPTFASNASGKLAVHAITRFVDTIDWVNCASGNVSVDISTTGLLITWFSVFSDVFSSTLLCFVLFCELLYFQTTRQKSYLRHSRNIFYTFTFLLSFLFTISSFQSSIFVYLINLNFKFSFARYQPSECGRNG